WPVPIAISGRRFPPPAPEPGDHLLPRPTSPRRLGRPRPRSVPFLLNSWSGRVGDRTALYGSPPCAFLPAAPLAERRNAQGCGLPPNTATIAQLTAADPTGR